MSNSSTSEQTAPATPRTKPVAKPKPRQLPPYHVILLNDDEHSYDYVIDMLESLFAQSAQQAFKIAEQVDRTGRAIVCTTHKERAELKRDQILSFGRDVRIARCKGSMNAVVMPADGHC